MLCAELVDGDVISLWSHLTGLVFDHVCSRTVIS